MEIDLSRLILNLRERETFSLQTMGNDSFLEEIGGKFIAPIKVEIVVEKSGMIFVGRGNVRTLLQLPCSRCLKDFTFPVDAEFEFAMAEAVNSDQVSVDDGIIFFEADEADIMSIVEEAIFMAIPICSLCREDCRGLCLVCGQDRNTTSCSCQQETIDPRWEKLKSLQ
ncbi:MAG: DUF177 domain-containing protein [Syntrophomonas sp.]|nr:DUF177 domain-containing protein [Syntrophomonas sp.]